MLAIPVHDPPREPHVQVDHREQRQVDSREDRDRDRERQTVGTLQHDVRLERSPVRRIVAALEADRDAAQYELREEDDHPEENLHRDELGRRHRWIAAPRAELHEIGARAEREDGGRELQEDLVRPRSLDDSRERDREGDAGHEGTGGDQVQTRDEKREPRTVHAASPPWIRHEERPDLERSGAQPEEAGQKPGLRISLQRADRPGGEHHGEDGQSETKEKRAEVPTVHGQEPSLAVVRKYRQTEPRALERMCQQHRWLRELWVRALQTCPEVPVADTFHGEFHPWPE